MPALSPTMTDGVLQKWLVKVGDKVKAGDLIAEIETDKATMEVEAVDEGTLGKILVAEGTEGVPVNQVIALLLEEGEDASALESAKTTAPTPATAPVPQSADEPAAEGSEYVHPPSLDQLGGFAWIHQLPDALLASTDADLGAERVAGKVEHAGEAQRQQLGRGRRCELTVTRERQSKAALVQGR